MHKMDPSIPILFSGYAGIKIFFLYCLGLLPFVPLYQDAFSVPYMTKDYLEMKLKDAREITPRYYFLIAIVIGLNYIGNGMIDHLNKRGIFTNYWVINDEIDMKKINYWHPV